MCDAQLINGVGEGLDRSDPVEGVLTDSKEHLIKGIQEVNASDVIRCVSVKRIRTCTVY